RSCGSGRPRNVSRTAPRAPTVPRSAPRSTAAGGAIAEPTTSLELWVPVGVVAVGVVCPDERPTVAVLVWKVQTTDGWLSSRKVYVELGWNVSVYAAA